MKKTLLFFVVCLLAGNVSVFAQSFGAGNLVVYRYGDGSTYTNGQLVPVFLDEYNTSGLLVKTRKVPSVANGVNKGLTGLLKLASDGKYQQEGMSTLSQDGKYITIIGYNAAVGATVPSAADGLVVGVIAADGSINTTTTLSSDPTTGLGAPRSAIIDISASEDANIWTNGFNNGVQFTTLGSTSSTRVSSAQNSPTTLGIFDNSLVAPIGTSGDLAYATPLPTSSKTFSIRGGLGTGNAINQVVEFPFSDRKVMYVVDDVNNQIRRYSTNGGGTDWINAKTYAVTETGLIKSITGTKTIDGTNTIFTLYVTSWGNDGTGTATSRLYKFSETVATQATGGLLSTSGTATALTLLATAPAGTVFRSVTMAPQGSTSIGTSALTVLPVSLTSFNGVKKDDAIQLKWTTASEKNNSHFDVLRSSNGKGFTAIGKVTGKGNSNQSVNYSFSDTNPLSGTNYYQLSQVDFNGNATRSNVVAVASGLEATNMTIYSDANSKEVKLNIFSANKTSGTVNIFDLQGKRIFSKTVELEKGYNNLSVALTINSGLFVATLETNSETISKKFTVQ